MKKFLYAFFLLVALIPAGIALRNRCFAEREIVILSTNDIHANLENFPRLATAVAECRDTVTCILVDAGDRWTGNVFVDLAPEPRKPIVDLMNRLGYRVATFGNHEFDSGREFLAEMMKNYRFKIVCANIRGTEKGKFPEIDPYTVIKAGGIKIGFAGVVTNFQNNHPEGNDASFEGLEFPDAFAAAQKALDEMKPKCDVSVLISHLGCDNDSLLLTRTSGYDLMISGHTHRLLDTEINGTIVGQTKKALNYVGVTTIRTKGGKVLGIDYRNVELKDYPLDPEYQALVDHITADPYLNQKVGYNAAALNKDGLGAMHTTTTRDAVGADLSFYHTGGVRLSELPADSVSRATLINSDIFISHLYTLTMTPAQMRKFIIAKYNDVDNPNESHRVDLYSTEPYTIITDSSDTAVDVEFPTLQEGRKYKTAICSYVVENYKDIEGENKVYYDMMTVPDIFIDYFEKNSPVTFSNEKRQTVRQGKAR